jgi:hypothetical protein
LLPWWSRHVSDNPDSPTSDCATCTAMLTTHDRQMIGCGFLPAMDARVRLSVWQPTPFSPKLGYNGPAVTTCAGYTCSLPEVIEVVRARTHWTKGQITAFTGGQPSDHLLAGVEILDAECSRYERWAQTPTEEGGGR